MRTSVLAACLACALAGPARSQTQITTPQATMIAAMQVDADGNIYVAGSTPPSNPRSVNDTSDVFVSKVTPGGQILYWTELGGNNIDTATALALTPDGTALIGGDTASPDFPVTPSSAQSTFRGSSDGFLAAVAPNGTVRWATYAGTQVFALASDASGAVYVTGQGSGFGGPVPTTVQFFTAKLDSTGKVLFSNPTTGGSVMAVDSSGIYIAGSTSESITTTDGSFQPSLPPGAPAACFVGQMSSVSCDYQYVAKLGPDGTETIYATFLTGATESFPAALSIDSRGNVYTAGSAASTCPYSSDCPPYPVTAGAYQQINLAVVPPFPTSLIPPAPGYAFNGFVTGLNADGNSLLFSTFLGGSDSDQVTGMRQNAVGDFYLAGSAASPDFPGLAVPPA